MIHTLEPILREHPFFEGMEDRHIQLIAGCSMNVRFDAGHAIFREGDPADQFYLIREGLVSVQFVIPHRGLTTIMTVGNAEVLGWSWLFLPIAGTLTPEPSSRRTRWPLTASAFAQSAMRTTTSVMRSTSGSCKS